MKKILGIADAMRFGMVTSDSTEPVTVTEGEKSIILKQASSPHAARLSITQARALSDMLLEIANRVEGGSNA